MNNRSSLGAQVSIPRRIGSESFLGILPALILALVVVWPSAARAQSEESVARFCLGIGGTWARVGERSSPDFIGPSPPQRDASAYWRHVYRGVSLPIPMETDGWQFWFGNSSFLSDMIGLSHSDRDITYTFAPSQVPELISDVGALAANLGLPRPDIESMELTRLALTIEPEKVVCNPDDVQQTVNNLSAIYVKTLLFSTEDKAYFHGDGLLAHSAYEIGESWTYIFEDDAGRWSRIKISHERPGEYPDIGFEIDDRMLTQSLNSPAWMPLFFEAASEPVKDRLIRLRDIIVDYPLPEGTDQMLDAKISELR